MKLQIKRAYDPAQRSDGFRVLVDRLWPRGVSKEKAKINLWAKDAAPSAELRTWFHADTEGRLEEFSDRYERELREGRGLSELKMAIKGKKAVTLVTAVKDIEHSHVPVLSSHLKR